MNKDIVLQKARKDMAKEEYQQVEFKGLKLGYLIFVIAYAFLVLFNFSQGKEIYQISALFWIMFATQSYSKYITYRRKSILVGLVASSFCAVVFLIDYVITTLGLSFFLFG